MSFRISANLCFMSPGWTDYARLVTVLGEAHDLDGPAPFDNKVLDRVADSLGCDFASYYELDFTTGEFSFHTLASYEESLGLRPPSRYQGDDLARHLGYWGPCQEGVTTWSELCPERCDGGCFCSALRAARLGMHRHGLDDVRRPPIQVEVVLGHHRTEPQLHQGAARPVSRLPDTRRVVDPPRRHPTSARRSHGRSRRG